MDELLGPTDRAQAEAIGVPPFGIFTLVRLAN
jgi:hypothetical protein